MGEFDIDLVETVCYRLHYKSKLLPGFEPGILAKNAIKLVAVSISYDALNRDRTYDLAVNSRTL